MSWVTDPANSALLGGWSFILAVGGTFLTLIGLWATFYQAREARRSARDAEQAVSDFKFRADRYDAFRDLSQASYAFEMTKRHLNNDAWRDAAESYEDARQAIIRMQLAAPEVAEAEAKRLKGMTTHMANFCDAVELGDSGKGVYPDKLKVLATIRRNYATIVTMQRALQEDRS